jgi:hypothetical protein
MTSTPCSPAKSRLTLSTLRPHNSAISAGEKWRSIAAVWDRISMTCCDTRSIHPLLIPHAGSTQRRHSTRSATGEGRCTLLTTSTGRLLRRPKT